MKMTKAIKKRFDEEEGVLNKAKYTTREATHLGLTTALFCMPISKAEVDEEAKKVAERKAARKAEAEERKASLKGEPFKWDMGSFLALAVLSAVPAGLFWLFSASWVAIAVVFVVCYVGLGGLLETGRRADLKAVKDSDCPKSDDMLTLAGNDEPTNDTLTSEEKK